MRAGVAAPAQTGRSPAIRTKAAATAVHRPATRPRHYRHDDLVAVDLFCVDEQTEILTAAGWKRYDQLAVGDTALTIRPDGSAAEWQPVEAVNVFPAEPRKLQLIEGRGISALTTDNHRWLSNYRATTPSGRAYRWRVVRSDELTCEDRIPMSAPVANLPTDPTVPDALVELVAWYWTEGTDRECGRVHITQDHTVNPQHVAAIRSTLVEAFGPEREKRKRPDGPLWAENRCGTQTTFGLNRTGAAALRAAAPSKVPAVGWLATLTQAQLDLFIQRSLDADGHERARGAGRVERVLSQCDKARASAFQAACLMAGHAASMKRYESTYRHAGTARLVESWAVTVGMREFVKPLRQKRVEWVEHDGIAWCPTTPNGTWLARRNGTAYFTGNSGFGGLTQGIKRAGFTTIMAANHNDYKVRVHEANHPEAEHWIADLVDPESSDYHSARDLPAGDLLVAGVSCVNHSHANSTKAYARGLSLFDMETDPDYEARVTRSERDRATANCVLHYAETHHPLALLVECTTEFASWGPALPNKPKIGDGSTHRWWLKEFDKLNYRCQVLYLNSMFFDVPQSRDRGFWVFTDKRLPKPDLDHRPISWCGHCDQLIEAVWTWRTGIPPTGTVRYGKQYDYRCPRCRGSVFPPMTPSLAALDLTDLGTRIGDKPIKTHRDGSTGPLAAATLARAERCRQKFADFPAVLMPAKAIRGVERHPWQPMATQTSQQETALLSTGAVIAAHRHNGEGQHIGRPMDTVTSTHEKALLTTGALIAAAGNTYERPGSECRSRGLDEPLWAQTATNTTGLLTPPIALAVDNYQGTPRGVDDPLPTQGGSETLGIVSSGIVPLRHSSVPRAVGDPLPTQGGSENLGVLSSGIVPFRQNTVPTVHGEPMPTVTSDQVPGLLTAAGTIKNNGAIDEAQYRAHPLSDPLGTVVGSAVTQGMLFSGWYKQNGKNGTETAPHPMSDPFGTLTSRDTTGLLMAEWREALAELRLEDCYFRMMASHEIGRGCGFDVNFPGYDGTFIVWGSARDQVDGFGNAVSPQIGEWIGARLLPVLHGQAIT